MDSVLVLFMWAGGAELEKKLVKYEYDPAYSLQLPLSIVDINGTSGMLFDGAAAASTVIENLKDSTTHKHATSPSTNSCDIPSPWKASSNIIFRMLGYIQGRSSCSYDNTPLTKSDSLQPLPLNLKSSARPFSPSQAFCRIN